MVGTVALCPILLLFLIVYFLILRPLKQQILIALRELPERAARAPKELGPVAAAGNVEIELPPGSEQARRATALKRQLTDKIKSEPAAASRLVQSWIREDSKP